MTFLITVTFNINFRRSLTGPADAGDGVAASKTGKTLIGDQLLVTPGRNPSDIPATAYAPQVGLHEKEKRRFWGVLDEVVSNVPSSEKFFLGGDFNGHIEALPVGYEEVHGSFVFGDRNDA
ncbi:uncharacterized protein LOC124888963 [Capsicum annuum]|uniref:uncharacterized protein LOC124888963 n=1 Tax=Capsicum annuum TaxID=4072 RepID=UPI001FB15FC2|nr:uncharacterized protein LOC124888963 [Capsicum annuum]